MNIFGGMKILWIYFFLSYHKIGPCLGVTSMHFRVNVQNWGYFLGVGKISNIFLGA